MEEYAPETAGSLGRPERRRYLDVAEEILQAVALGAITVGDRLPNERELAARCQVGRSTVREALLALELSGVIEVRPGSGCYLTGMVLPGAMSPAPPLDASPLDASPRELLEVRRIVEPPAAQMCARRLGPGELRGLYALVDEAERIGVTETADGFDRFVRLNLAFHRELAQLCGNAILASLTSHLVDAGQHPMWLLVDSLVVRNPATRAAQLKEHRTVLAAIEGHRDEEAARAMATHLGALSARIFGPAPSRVHRARPGLPA
jgi:DNA-binding FadR family transcriptional regulator